MDGTDAAIPGQTADSGRHTERDRRGSTPRARSSPTGLGSPHPYVIPFAAVLRSVAIEPQAGATPRCIAGCALREPRTARTRARRRRTEFWSAHLGGCLCGEPGVTARGTIAWERACGIAAAPIRADPRRCASRGTRGSGGRCGSGSSQRRDGDPPALTAGVGAGVSPRPDGAQGPRMCLGESSMCGGDDRGATGDGLREDGGAMCVETGRGPEADAGGEEPCGAIRVGMNASTRYARRNVHAGAAKRMRIGHDLEWTGGVDTGLKNPAPVPEWMDGPENEGARKRFRRNTALIAKAAAKAETAATQITIQSVAPPGAIEHHQHHIRNRTLLARTLAIVAARYALPFQFASSKEFVNLTALYRTASFEN